MRMHFLYLVRKRAWPELYTIIITKKLGIMDLDKTYYREDKNKYKCNYNSYLTATRHSKNYITVVYELKSVNRAENTCSGVRFIARWRRAMLNLPIRLLRQKPFHDSGDGRGGNAILPEVG